MNGAHRGSAARPHATIPALDGFRAIAIGIVICSHIGLQRVVPGQFGVTLFFFLSGFLITTLLRREIEGEGHVDFRRFYLRRAIRILPPMYLTIVALVLLSWMGLIHPIETGALSFDFLFLSNYLPMSGIPIGLWSLAVEEHFYLAFPVALGLLARRLSFGQCALVCLGICAAVLAIRLWEVSRLGDFSGVGVWTHTRIDSIVFGSILALWNNPVADRRDILPSQTAGYAIAALLLLPTFLVRDEGFRQTFRYTLQGLGLIALFNAAIRDRGVIGAVLNSAAARHVAALSYTLYLVHSGLIEAFVGGRQSTLTLWAMLAIGVSYYYAVLMRRWVERPLAAWRQRREAAIRGNREDEAGPDKAYVAIRSSSDDSSGVTEHASLAELPHRVGP